MWNQCHSLNKGNIIPRIRKLKYDRLRSKSVWIKPNEKSTRRKIQQIASPRKKQTTRFFWLSPEILSVFPQKDFLLDFWSSILFRFIYLSFLPSLSYMVCVCVVYIDVLVVKMNAVSSKPNQAKSTLPLHIQLKCDHDEKVHFLKIFRFKGNLSIPVLGLAFLNKK